jgi:hypothetical protein
VLLIDGIRTLVDVVIVDLTKVNLVLQVVSSCKVYVTLVD